MRLLQPRPGRPQKEHLFLSGHDLFLKRVGASYHAFIDEVEKSCKAKVMEDLTSTTRYVTWSLHTKNYRALRNMLSQVRRGSQAVNNLRLFKRVKVCAALSAGYGTLRSMLGQGGLNASNLFAFTPTCTCTAIWMIASPACVCIHVQVHRWTAATLKHSACVRR